MIQFDRDGVTLFYNDANGQRVAAGVFDSEKYSAMLTVRGDQQQAAIENTQTVANYSNVLANVQISVTAGRGDTVTAPAKPLQKVVSDTGGVSYTPFVPPLADLVIPRTVPSGPIAAPSLDKQAIMYNMILAMFRKAFPDA